MTTLDEAWAGLQGEFFYDSEPFFVEEIGRHRPIIEAAVLRAARERIEQLPQMDVTIGPWPGAGAAPAVLLPAVLAALTEAPEALGG